VDGFIQQVFAGAANGAIYAALGVALVIIYQATHHINFAQGEMAMFSTYIAWVLINAGIPYWWAFAATIALSFVGGVAIQRIVLRPFDRAPALSVILVSVGLLLVFNSLAGWLFTYTMKSFPSPFPATAPSPTNYLSIHEIGIVLVTGAMLAVVYVFFRFTRLGLAMRAAAENPVSSALSGINVGRMLAIGWGLAAAVGAVAGMLVAPIVFLDPNMMSGIIIYSLAAALLGGITNPWGAMVGGFIVGIAENIAGAYLLGTEVKLAVALAIIVGVLLIKPAGLFGQRSVKRV
jgi:branched-chain amino acid transport system permease protein